MRNARLPGEPANLPDNETDPIKLFFVHGLNVDATESADWSGRLFKRLYQTGFRGRYVGMDWNGDEGLDCNYAENVEHAFRSAPYFAEVVNQLRGNDKVAVLAHSLGNMLVCSAIQDTELQTDFYGMLNAAVASEAFDPNLFEPLASNPMVPYGWKEYKPSTWSALWHTLFTATDRRFLTWKGRFADVAMQTILVNYYDSEDEVLGLKTEGRVDFWSGWTFTGFSVTSRRYAWHKQEHAKGTYLLNVLGGTTEAGWGKEKAVLDSYTAVDGIRTEYFMRSYTSAEANEIPESALGQLSHAVFRRNPASIDQDVIPLETRNHLLAYAFPALSAPAGCRAVPEIGGEKGNIDLVGQKNSANGWPRNTGFEIKSIWSHSDFIIVPYFYTHLLYENIVPRLDTLLLSEETTP